MMHQDISGGGMLKLSMVNLFKKWQVLQLWYHLKTHWCAMNSCMANLFKML